jgi:tetratricopeptide (TPR) repeat protein
VQDDYYVASRDKGVALDLRVSIALANLLVDRAGDSDETGAALNNLGIALATLGERDSGTERLEQAVEAFQQALKEYTRDRVPLDWAATQKNLGTALQTLGARDSDTDRLEQAVEAYQQALKERTRDRVPLDWAMTRYNWAITELTLFEKTAQAAHLDRAQDLLRTAAAEFAAAGASHYVDMAAGLQAKIDAARVVRSRRLGAGRFKC